MSKHEEQSLKVSKFFLKKECKVTNVPKTARIHFIQIIWKICQILCQLPMFTTDDTIVFAYLLTPIHGLFLHSLITQKKNSSQRRKNKKGWDFNRNPWFHLFFFGIITILIIMYVNRLSTVYVSQVEESLNFVLWWKKQTFFKL